MAELVPCTKWVFCPVIAIVSPCCPCCAIPGVSCVNCGTGDVITVGSIVFAFAKPPPETLAAFVRGELAPLSTLTLTVMAGKVAPLVSTSLREHVVEEQVHPVPDIDTRVRPAGTVSLTVTVPAVDTELARLETVSV